MKKIIALLLVFATAFTMMSTALAEQPDSEPEGKLFYHMLPMYYWMLSKLDAEMTCEDINTLQEKDGTVDYYCTGFWAHTFANSEIIQEAQVVFDAQQWDEQASLLARAFLFAMKYSFQEVLWIKNPMDTVIADLDSIIHSLLNGKACTFGSYVYYMQVGETAGALSFSLHAEHTDLYKAQHPGF